MVAEFAKYKQILEREDQEFRKAKEAEVSMSWFLLFSPFFLNLAKRKT